MGKKFKADGERQRYNVVAASDDFVIAIKPMNARRTYLYTIIDRNQQTRGRCNLVFGIPFDLRRPTDAAEALEWLHSGAMQVSHRNFKYLTESEIAQLASL